MEDNIVKNTKGVEVFESTCRMIGDEYYSIGDKKIENSGEIFLINKRYIRTENLTYNHTIKEYVITNASLIVGIIDFKNKNQVEGYFEKNELYNVKLIDKDGSLKICLNKEVISLDYREHAETGVFYHISKVAAANLNRIQKVSREYKESLPYDSRNIMEKYIASFNKNYKPNITSSVKTYSPLLKDYTFGLEFETTKGILPKEKLNILPLIPLRDGSIAGLEYVTIPLKGEIGLQALIDSVGELSKKTKYDDTCALHYHIGGIPRTPEFILAFYKVSCFFQEEMFSMFPLYKKYNFGVKRKNYSKPFDFNKVNMFLEPSVDINNKEQLNKNFNFLFRYLSGGVNFSDYGDDLSNVKEHPKDPNGTQKWNISTRYYAVNFIPILFGNKETVEFRIHTPTYDIGKIINFLLLNIYLIDFTVNNTEQILRDPAFLTKFENLRFFIENYVNSNKLVKKNKLNLMDFHLDYIFNRLKDLEATNSRGDIVGNEEKIYCNSYVQWNSVDNVGKKINFGYTPRRRDTSYKPLEYVAKKYKPHILEVKKRIDTMKSYAGMPDLDLAIKEASASLAIDIANKSFADRYGISAGTDHDIWYTESREVLSIEGSSKDIQNDI